MFLCGKHWSVYCQYCIMAECYAPFFCPCQIMPRISPSYTTTSTCGRIIVGSENVDDQDQRGKEFEKKGD